MKINVNVKLKQKEASIILEPDGSFTVRLRSLPIENKANIEIIVLLAKYFKVPKANVVLVRGGKSRMKTFDIIN